VTIAGLSRACYGLCTLLGRQEKSAEVATELRGSPSPVAVRPAPVRPAPPAEAAAQPRRLESGSASGANRDVGGRRGVVRAILVLYCSGDTHPTYLAFRRTDFVQTSEISDQSFSTDREASFAPTHAALPVGGRATLRGTSR
jgi:hypothetical protein